MIQPLVARPSRVDREVPGERSLRDVVFFGGGTGGHLTPGLALAERLRARHPQCRLRLFRTHRAVEGRVVDGGPLESQLLNLEPPAGGVGGKVRFATQCLREFETMRRQLSASPVDVAVGLGGYPTIPGILAARSEGIPIVLLEQNAVPGKVNRLFGPLASRIACPDALSMAHFGTWRWIASLVDTGSPVRDAVSRASAWRAQRAAAARRAEVGVRDRRILLVTGGSQGAHRLNQAVVDMLLGAPQLRDRVFCIHVAGERDAPGVRERYREAGWMAKVSAYERSLPLLLACADLVIGRAGGSSVSELAAIGVPSVLVPYPGHADRHQLHNARRLERVGGCRIVEQDRFGPPAWHETLELLFSDTRLEAMGRAALGLGRLDAADRLVDLLEELACS